VKRRIFNLLAAVSLVMCVAAVVFWVRGYVVGLEFLQYNRISPTL
jgi:hypothetical protein